MLRKKKRSEPEEAEGAPDWMLTFSDCMTLLLTFFVLLLSFSSFDKELFPILRVIFAKKLSSISLDTTINKEAFVKTTQFDYQPEIEVGSEKPTLEKGMEDTSLKDTSTNFQDRKIFLISSGKVFLGKGKVISVEGRKTLSTMASFLKEMPSRVVISENLRAFGANNNMVPAQTDIGLQRAWAVIDYFSSKEGLDKGRFSISAASTVTQESLKSSGPGYTDVKAKRMLEIIFLERSIYN